MNWPELAFLVVAALVAFVHWLIKESGLFSGKSNPHDDLSQQMEGLHEKRASRHGPAAPSQRGGMSQQDADWRALREAMGLPVGEEPNLAPPPPPPVPQRPYYSQEREPQPYEDMAEANYEEDLPPPLVVAQPAPGRSPFLRTAVAREKVEEETEGARSAIGTGEIFPPLTSAEVALIKTLRENKLDPAEAKQLAAERAVQDEADLAYETPMEGRERRSLLPMDISRVRLRDLLSTPQGARQMILAREVFGRPKAWEPEGGVDGPAAFRA